MKFLLPTLSIVAGSIALVAAADDPATDVSQGLRKNLLRGGNDAMATPSSTPDDEMVPNELLIFAGDSKVCFVLTQPI